MFARRIGCAGVVLACLAGGLRPAAAEALGENFDSAFLSTAAADHAKTLDAVIHQQLDPPAAATLADSGGGRSVLESVRRLLAALLAPQEPTA